MTTIEFKVGDQVAVHHPGNLFDSFHSCPHHISKVVKVMKRFLELEDKSLCDLQGRPYPKLSDSRTSWVSPLTQEHIEMMESRKVWRSLISPQLKELEGKPESLTLNQLTRLHDLLTVFKTEKNEKANQKPNL